MCVVCALPSPIVHSPDRIPTHHTQEDADTAFGSWLFGHSIEPLFKFSMEKSMELFSGPIRIHALLFADSEDKDYAKVAAAVKDAAVKFRTQVRRGGDGLAWGMLDCSNRGACWLADLFLLPSLRSQQALSVEVAKNESRILEAFDLKDTCVNNFFHVYSRVSFGVNVYAAMVPSTPIIITTD